MNKIYISEPKVINAAIVERLVGRDYELVAGSPAFDGNDLADCTVLLIRSATTVPSTIKETFPNLKHIVRVGVGVDNIDMDFCEREGIAVYNAPGANADAVSDYVIGLVFYALRRIHLLERQDIETWNRFKFTGHSMSARRIGIIGFGNIGKQIFRKLQGFGCPAFYVYDPFIKKEDMPDGVTYAETIEEVLRNSDIVTLHVPLLPTTKYLINEENLALLPEDAILVNTSRGGIVNEADVVEHMKHHELTYIADTVEHEPHVAESLLDAPGVIVTPHIASLTKESDDQMVEVALQNFIDGRPMNGTRL